MSWATGRSAPSSAAAPLADGQPPSELGSAVPAGPAPLPCHTLGLDHDMDGQGLDMVEGGRGGHGEVAGEGAGRGGHGEVAGRGGHGEVAGRGGHGEDAGRRSHGEVAGEGAGPEGDSFGWPVPCEVKSSHQQKWAELSVGFLVRPYLRQNRGLRTTVCVAGQCADAELAVWWVWLVVE